KKQRSWLQPELLLFTNNASLVWALIASLLVANFMLIVLNLPLIGLWVRLLTIPKPWLYGGILVFATLGTLGANGGMSGRLGPISFSFELLLLLAFGILGYLLRRFGYPIAPVVVGLILGPMAEQQLRRALAISQGDPIVLFHSPIAITLYVVALLAVALPFYLRWRGRGQMLSQLASDED
nr:tripartite tricarboxylate transporter permease [Pseudomonas sp.]